MRSNLSTGIHLDGEALKSWSTQVLPKERRQVLLDGLSNFLFSIWTLGEAQDTQVTRKVLFKG